MEYPQVSNPSSVAALGVVKGAVGFFQKRGGARDRRGSRRHAEARRDGLQRPVERRDGIPVSLGAIEGDNRIGLPKQDRELIAAVPRHHVVGSGDQAAGTAGLLWL